MRAIKLNAHVAKDRTLRLHLPQDVQEGPAEIIVLVPEGTERPTHKIQDFLAGLSARPRRIRTKEEIDTYLEQERASWN